MLLLEVNEFNVDLVSEIANRLRLQTLLEILQWPRTETLTSDTYDSGLLEPWVQWASIHTGVPSTVHGIRNLGETPGEKHVQLWERWSENGEDSIVWGVMNGSRRHALRCHAFVPDPWTFSENAYPAALHSLISLPRYLAKNYLAISKFKTVTSALPFFRALLTCVDKADLFDALKILIDGLRKFGAKHHVFIIFFEYVSAMAFARSLREHKPTHAIIFINTLAHVQHHYWREASSEPGSELDHAAKIIDDILGKLITRFRANTADDIFVMNGLSQMNTRDDPPWVLHRPIDPQTFLNFLGIYPKEIEPLMTHDAHLIFDSEKQRNEAYEILTQTRINNIPLLFVEKNDEHSKTLFYRLDFFDPVDDKTTFRCGNLAARFYEYFASIVTRTGKHIPSGSVFANRESQSPQPQVANHEMYRVLLTRAPVTLTR